MPINDIYGPEECRNVIPDCTAAGVGMQGSPVYITTKAVEDGKDIAALCAFFDYFYTEEGAVVKTVGLNQEQVQASGSDFYEKNGLTEGAYTNVSDGKDSPGKGTEEKEKGHFSGRAYPWLINYGGTIDLIGTILPSIHKYEFAWDEKKKGLYLAAQPPVHEGLAPEVNGYRWTDAVDGWTYEGYEGKPTWVDAYTDAAEVEIFINGTSAGRSPVKDYYAKVPCFYQPGELLGVGYDGNGKELYRTSVRTAGQETEICAVPDKCELPEKSDAQCRHDRMKNRRKP